MIAEKTTRRVDPLNGDIQLRRAKKMRAVTKVSRNTGSTFIA